jgi:hypothetical protein
MGELHASSKDELWRGFQEAKSDLEDLEEVRAFTLGQSGMHIGALRLKSLQASWTREEVRLRQQMAIIEALLGSQRDDDGQSHANFGGGSADESG